MDSTTPDSIEKVSTTINNIPDEILETILKYMNGKDMVYCSEVCHRWENVVNGISENFWKARCTREYPSMYEKTKRTSGLPWRELYESLSLWQFVADADICMSIQPVGTVHYFNVLRDGVISFASRLDLRRCTEFEFDTAVYYDVNKRQVISTQKFGVNFIRYVENDHLIVFEFDSLRKPSQIRIIPKIYRTRYKNETSENMEHGWLLKGTEVFYLCKEVVAERYGNYLLCRIRVILSREGVKYENKVLARTCWFSIVDVEYVDDKLYVFQGFIEADTVVVSVLKNGLLQVVYHTRKCDDISILKFYQDLKPFGLRPTHRFSWFGTYIHMEANCQIFSNHYTASPFPYGPHLITGLQPSLNSPGALSIYRNYYDRRGNFPMIESSPTTSVDMTSVNTEIRSEAKSLSWWICKNVDGLFNQIEVVETYRGHLILLQYCKNLVVIDISHPLPGDRQNSNT